MVYIVFGKEIGKTLYIGNVIVVIMSEITTLTKATSESKSLRTTVPAGIVRQFKLKEGDKIEWEMEVREKEIIIVIKPL